MRIYKIVDDYSLVTYAQKHLTLYRAYLNAYHKTQK